MTGFLDRLLHADKPQPLDVDTAAAMLSTRGCGRFLGDRTEGFSYVQS